MPVTFKSLGPTMNGPYAVLKKPTPTDGWVFDSIHETHAEAELKASQLVIAPTNNFQSRVMLPGDAFEWA